MGQLQELARVTLSENTKATGKETIVGDNKARSDMSYIQSCCFFFTFWLLKFSFLTICASVMKYKQAYNR